MNSYTKKMGIPKTTFANWLNGKNTPTNKKRTRKPIIRTHPYGGGCEGKNHQNSKRKLAQLIDPTRIQVERIQVTCYTCPKKFFIYKNTYLNSKNGKFFCNNYCQDFFSHVPNRRSREALILRTHLGFKASVLPLDIRQKYATVRIFTHFEKNHLGKVELRKILKFIEKGHTFMAYMSLNKRKVKNAIK